MARSLHCRLAGTRLIYSRVLYSPIPACGRIAGDGFGHVAERDRASPHPVPQFVLDGPYTVSVWIHPKGKPWGWYYYDHEDSWWWSGHIQIDPDGTKARILRGKCKVGELDMASMKFTTITDPDFKREPKWLPNGWEPAQGKYFPSEFI